jgi:hypothetical protein
MTNDSLRQTVRTILRRIGNLHVTGAKKVGIDHKEGYVIYLSDGRQDYAPLEGFTLKGSAPAMYQCKLITGILHGRLDGGAHSYEFDGIDCEEYVEIDIKTIKLSNQIS